MMINKQEQQAGNNSTNIQTRELVINNGITYSEAKEVALDVFRACFYELAGKAHDVARARAEEITVEFLTKLQTENPLGFSQSEDPNFQQALFTVQKEYALTGDKELGDLLVDLLVDRSKHEQRSILQIVLNESLSIAPKLTDHQLAALAIIFLFRHTVNHGIGNHKMLGQYFDTHVLPFVKKLSKNDSCYQHLAYSGCGSPAVGAQLETIIQESYRGMFFRGFDATEVALREIEIGLDPRLFGPCLNDSNKFQIKAVNYLSLQKSLGAHSVGEKDRDKIQVLFNLEIMTSAEVMERCVLIRPYMEQVFSIWNSSTMGSFFLTSVGIAIGHANIKRLIGEFSDLSTWIN